MVAFDQKVGLKSERKVREREERGDDACGLRRHLAPKLCDLALDPEARRWLRRHEQRRAVAFVEVPEAAAIVSRAEPVHECVDGVFGDDQVANTEQCRQEHLAAVVRNKSRDVRRGDLRRHGTESPESGKGRVRTALSLRLSESIPPDQLSPSRSDQRPSAISRPTMARAFIMTSSPRVSGWSMNRAAGPFSIQSA